jgi:hypothetical protein
MDRNWKQLPPGDIGKHLSEYTTSYWTAIFSDFVPYKTKEYAFFNEKAFCLCEVEAEFILILPKAFQTSFL